MKSNWFGKAIAIIGVCAMVTILMIYTREALCLIGLLAIPCICDSD